MWSILNALFPRTNPELPTLFSIATNRTALPRVTSTDLIQ
jgi:hypothetical protein